jgi:hypothetical protein
MAIFGGVYWYTAIVGARVVCLQHLGGRRQVFGLDQWEKFGVPTIRREAEEDWGKRR